MKRMQKDPDMLEAYDFSKGIQGKYSQVIHVLFAVDVEGDNARVVTAYRPSTDETARTPNLSLTKHCSC